MDITTATYNVLRNRIGHLFNCANSKDINLNLLTEFVCWLQTLQHKCYFTDSTNKKLVQPKEITYFYITNKKYRSKWGRYKGAVEHVERTFDWSDYFIHGKEEQVKITTIVKNQIYKMDIMLELLTRYEVIRLLLNGNRHAKVSTRFTFTSQFVNEILNELKAEHEHNAGDLKFECTISDEEHLYTDKESFLYEELFDKKIRISPLLTMSKAIQLLESSEKIKRIDEEILELGKVDSINCTLNQLNDKRMNLIQASLYSLEKFIKKGVYVKEDMTTGRLYSSFSSLPRLFRKYHH